jgi:hypothetical protein
MAGHFKIQLDFIESIKDNHSEMKAFALYLKIKSRYKSSVVYNYSPEKLSKDFNVSIYEARKYVAEMCRMDLCVRQYAKDTRLYLTSFRNLKITEKGKREILNIHATDKIKNVVVKLRYVLLRYHLINKQLYIKNAYTDVVNLEARKGASGYSFQDKKRILRKVKKLNRIGYSFLCPEKVSVKIYAGYRKMASICGCSVDSVLAMLLALKRMGYIKGFLQLIEQTDKNVLEYEFSDMRNTTRGHVFAFNNTVYIHRGTQILMESR